MLVECVLNLKQESIHSTLWKFDINSFKNNVLKKEILEEIQEAIIAANWNIHKIYIKSIIKAFRKPKAPEDKIERLNKKVSQTKEAIAKNPNQTYIFTILDTLNLQI